MTGSQYLSSICPGAAKCEMGRKLQANCLLELGIVKWAEGRAISTLDQQYLKVGLSDKKGDVNSEGSVY